MSMCHTKKWKLLLWSWYAFKPCFSWEHTLNTNTSHASNAFLLYIYNFRYHHTSGDKQSKFFIRRSLCAHFVVFLFHIFKAAIAFSPCPVINNIVLHCTVMEKNIGNLTIGKDVFLIFTIFPKVFSKKWYLIRKPWYRAFTIRKEIGLGSILRVATPS